MRVVRLRELLPHGGRFEKVPVTAGEFGSQTGRSSLLLSQCDGPHHHVLGEFVVASGPRIPGGPTERPASVPVAPRREVADEVLPVATGVLVAKADHVRVKVPLQFGIPPLEVEGGGDGVRDSRRAGLGGECVPARTRPRSCSRLPTTPPPRSGRPVGASSIVSGTSPPSRVLPSCFFRVWQPPDRAALAAIRWQGQDAVQRQHAQEFVVPELERRGREPQEAAHAPGRERLEIQPGLHLPILEPVYLVDDDQRELAGQIRHERRGGSGRPSRCEESVFVRPAERRRAPLSEPRVGTQRPIVGAFQIRRDRVGPQRTRTCVGPATLRVVVSRSYRRPCPYGTNTVASL